MSGACYKGSICHLESVGTMLLHTNMKIFWKKESVIQEARTRKVAMEEMGAAYMSESLVTLAGSRLYTSAAQSDNIIDEALVRFDRFLQNTEGVNHG